MLLDWQPARVERCEIVQMDKLEEHALDRFTRLLSQAKERRSGPELELPVSRGRGPRVA